MKTSPKFFESSHDFDYQVKVSRRTIVRQVCLVIASIFILTINIYAQSEDCRNTDPVLGEDETLCSIHYSSNFLSEADYIIGAGTFITKASQLTGPITGKIAIVGDFLVDVPFTIHDAVILVWPDKKIEVNYGIASPYDEGYSNTSHRRPQLTLNNCDIFCCSYLWKGIEMGSVTSLIIKNGTQIEDAEKAVYAINTNGVIFDITETTFNRNLNGIYLSKNNYLLKDPIFSRFEGNTFSCTSTINTYDNKSGETGIYLNNINTNIGALSGTPQDYTTFDDIDNGIEIIGNTSFLRANFLKFYRCYKSDVHLNAGASFDIAHSKFYETYNTGIYGEALRNLYVSDCEFHFDFFDIEGEPNSRGIWMDAFPYGGKVNIQNHTEFITDNDIPSSKNCKGIYIKGNQSNSNVDIRIFDHNEFNFSGYALECIEMDGTFSNSFKCKIDYENHFNVHCPSTQGNLFVSCINLINGDKTNVIINGNYFEAHDQLNGSQSFAIRGVGSMGAGTNITSNEFGHYGTIDFELKSCLFLSYYQNAKICDNHDYFGAYNSFVFTGKSYNTDLVDNVTWGSGNGVWIPQGGTVIGNQKHRGNRFYYIIDYNPVTHKPRYWLPNAKSLSDPMLSHFYIHTPQSVFDYVNLKYEYFSEYFPDEVVPGDQTWWESDLSGTPAESCASRNELYVDTVDILIANDEIGDSTWTDATKWDSKRHLFSKLKFDSLYTANSIIFSDFLESTENALIQKLFIIEQLINKSATRTSGDSLLLDSLEMKINEQCYYRDSIAAIASWSSTDASNLNGITSYIDSLRYALNLIDENQRDYSNAYLDSASLLLNLLGVQSEDYIENTRKFFIYLTDVMKNGYAGLSNSEIEDILERADLCPEDGGFSVFGLRGLLDYCLGYESKSNLIQCDSLPYQDPILPDTGYTTSPFVVNLSNSILAENDTPIYQLKEGNIELLDVSCYSKLKIFSIDGHQVYTTNKQFDQINYDEIYSELNKFPPQIFIWHLYKCDGNVITIKTINRSR